MMSSRISMILRLQNKCTFNECVASALTVNISFLFHQNCFLQINTQNYWQIHVPCVHSKWLAVVAARIIPSNVSPIRSICNAFRFERHSLILLLRRFSSVSTVYSETNPVWAGSNVFAVYGSKFKYKVFFFKVCRI